MTERQINERRNWKAMAFPYDYFFPDETRECQYCLTDKQAELLRGLLEPVGWVTRWWSDDTDIDKDTIEAYRDDMIRRLMMSCCDSEFAIIFRWTVDGVLQKSEDGGETWEDDPQDDPRNSSPVYPPPTDESGDDPKCVAATGAVALIKEQIGDQLTDDMSRYTLGQLITNWVTTILQTSNPFQAIITIITNQIFALIIATLRPALTDDVYHQLVCILFCNMEDDFSFSDADWEQVRSDITAQITGIAGVFLEHLVYLLGKVGITNLVRSQGATEGDCSDCCPSCVSTWDVYPDVGNKFGIVIGRDTEAGTIEISGDVINTDAHYYVIVQTDDDNTCCQLLMANVTDGALSDPNPAWVACGNPRSGTFVFGLIGSTCVNSILFKSTTPFHIELTLADC